MSWRNARITLATAVDRVHRIENSDLNNRYRPACPGWAKLFSEMASLARLNRGMIEAAGIDRYLVPVTNNIGGTWWLLRLRANRCRYRRLGKIEAWAPNLVGVAVTGMGRSERGAIK